MVKYSGDAGKIMFTCYIIDDQEAERTSASMSTFHPCLVISNSNQTTTIAQCAYTWSVGATLVRWSKKENPAPQKRENQDVFLISPGTNAADQTMQATGRKTPLPPANFLFFFNFLILPVAKQSQEPKRNLSPSEN